MVSDGFSLGGAIRAKEKLMSILEFEIFLSYGEFGTVCVRGQAAGAEEVREIARKLAGEATEGETEVKDSEAPKVAPYKAPEKTFKQGDIIMVAVGSPPLYQKGDVGVVISIHDDGNTLYVDFNGHENPKVYNDGRWYVRAEDIL